MRLLLHASVARNASEPPSQSGFVIQYRTAPSAAAPRPHASRIQWYGPPSRTNAPPISDISSAYGRTNSGTSTSIHVNVWAPKLEM